MSKGIISVLVCALLVMGAVGAVWADPAKAPAEDKPVVVAQARSAASSEAAKPTDSKAVSERVTALEKENLVLREDLGKARLDAKSDLAEAAKRHQQAMDRLNRELADLRAQQEKERAAQRKRNRNLWIGVGIAVIGALAAN